MTINADLHELLDMHSYKRPYGSKTEAEYVKAFIEPLGITEDPFGNLYKIIGENPKTLWSSHTDSVHRTEGRQRVVVEKNIIKLHKKSNSSCLGADDAAGNWIMMQMIRAGIPGLYIFHFAEEVGCVGSSDLAKKAPEFLKGITSAIAFDRKGYDSIITHQGGRTASDAFAASLAAQLPGYKADPNGVFTDTRSYSHIIPECTNLSVGYHGAHTSNETLDYKHLFHLRDMMLCIDESKFDIARDPKQAEQRKFRSYYGGGSSYYAGASAGGSSAGTAASASSLRSEDSFLPLDISELIWRYPDDTAEVLEMMGVTFEDLAPLVMEERERRLAAKASQKKLPIAI